MEAHEYERLAVATRRAAERQRPAESSPRLTMPSAVLGLQRLAGNESVSALLAAGEGKETPPPGDDVGGSGGGAPIEAGARPLLEERMGQDFSDVRVHTGGKADESARSINAQAYTVGTDVVFRSGAYQPESPGGRHVLAHELAHVVQQRSGPVAGTPAPGGISISHPSDTFEQAAESSADRAMSSQGPATQSPATPAPASVQREGEEEEELQGAFVQREGDEEEELQGTFVQREGDEEEELQGHFVQRQLDDEEP